MVVCEVAGEADIESLSELLSTLFAQEAEFSPDPVAQARGLAAILTHPETGAILVARDGPRVLAMVNLLFTVSTALGERVAWLEDMVVYPEARQQGVGSALLAHALQWARQQGVRRVTLLTDADNTVAHQLYARQGFTPSSMRPWRLHLD